VLLAWEDKTLQLWDLESGETLRTLEHPDKVSAVAVTPDGRRAASASSYHTLRLWDLESGKQITTFTADASTISCVFAPDGRTIFSRDAFGKVHFLRLVEADITKLPIGELRESSVPSPRSHTAAAFRPNR
jgi:WD40 repeat protein